MCYTYDSLCYFSKDEVEKMNKIVAASERSVHGYEPTLVVSGLTPLQRG